MPLGMFFGGRGNKNQKGAPKSETGLGSGSSMPSEPEPSKYVPRKSWSTAGNRAAGGVIVEPPRIGYLSSAKGFDLREFGRNNNRDSMDSTGRVSVSVESGAPRFSS